MQPSIIEPQSTEISKQKESLEAIHDLDIMLSIVDIVEI